MAEQTKCWGVMFSLYQILHAEDVRTVLPGHHHDVSPPTPALSDSSITKHDPHADTHQWRSSHPSRALS